MNDNKPTVSIVIVTWNSEKDIITCLSGVLAQKYSNIIDVIVVDNNSSDKTVDLIKKNFPTVKLIENTTNRYFAGGHNDGIKYTIKSMDPDYIAILNPDTKVENDWIESMMNVALGDDKIGIVGPKILFWNNPNEGQINSAGLVYDGFMQGYDRGFMEEDKGQYDKTEDVSAVSGCSMLLRTQMINEIGLFWEPMQMYLEDLELCIRARKSGWRVVYTSNATVHHAWMQSTNKNKKLKLERMKIRNWLFIALRHYSLRPKIAMIMKFFDYKIKHIFS
jgi:hypothetical protein